MRFFSFYLAFYAVLGLVSSQQLPTELFFSVTYRDFLPSSCFYLFNSSIINVQKAAWNTNVNIIHQDNCDVLGDNAKWRAALGSFEISGHPDFEAEGQFTNQAVCTAGINGVNFPVSSCITQRGTDFSIIKDTLEISPSGIPKPVYCKSGSEDRRGFVLNNNQRVQTQTQKKFYDVWFTDDLTYNKRIGQRLRLAQDASIQGLYRFSSSGGNLAANDAPDFGSDPDTSFFGPLDRFKRGARALRAADFEDDPKDAPAWPQSINAANTNGFWITTELHTTFQFKNDTDMTFSFSGDDDFWAFINNKLVIDLGGLHDVRTATIDLRSDFNGRLNVAQFLGLENDGVYTLDIFHAERQTTASNFAVTTTLFPSCNVLQSGTESFNFRTGLFSQQQFNSLFFTTPDIVPTPGSPSFLLSQSTKLFASNFIYTKKKENIGRGFIANFLVRVTGPVNGFAFVAQNQGLENYRISGGSNFNFKGLTNSIAVVFDLCADRIFGNSCKEQDVRVHYPNSSNLPNNASSTTLRTHDKIHRNLKRNEFFPVEIIYYGGKPEFLEVYVNGSLYLRENNFDLTKQLDAEGGHVGLTATSGAVSADIEIKDFFLKTVEVEPASSSLLFDPSNVSVQNIVADGISLSEGFAFQTKDSCGNEITVGTLDGLVDAIFVGTPVQVTPENENRRLLQDDRVLERATVIDNQDGSYTMALKTNIVADFSLVFAFGQGCSLDTEVIPPVLVGDENACFFRTVDNAVISTPPAVVITSSPVAAPVVEDDGSLLVIIASSAGGLVCLGLVAAFVLIGYRMKWNRSKGYVKDGNLYKMEAQTEFNTADHYTLTGQKLLKTNEEILRLQAQGINPDNSQEIQKLRRENEEMKTMIRISKQRVNHVEEPVKPSRRGGKNKGKVEMTITDPSI